MEEYSGYVGLDVHKETIAVAVAWPGRGKPEPLGIIANSKRSLMRLLGKLSPNGEVLGFCYEASSCGYEVYRWLKQAGHECEVVAPWKIPKKSGERVKTDRRDAVKLASLYRSGELTPVRVPDEAIPSITDIAAPVMSSRSASKGTAIRLPPGRRRGVLTPNSEETFPPEPRNHWRLVRSLVPQGVAWQPFRRRRRWLFPPARAPANVGRCRYSRVAIGPPARFPIRKRLGGSKQVRGAGGGEMAREQRNLGGSEVTPWETTQAWCGVKKAIAGWEWSAGRQRA